MDSLDELTSLIRDEIKRQHKSIRQFSLVVDIPQSTISSALNKGIGSISFETAKLICDCLHISFLNNSTSLCISEDTTDFIKMYEQLDQEGRKTVNTIICAELLRSKKVPVSGVVKAFGGNTFSEELTANERAALLALKNIKGHEHE